MKFESYPVGLKIAVVGIALLLAGIYVPFLKPAESTDRVEYGLNGIGFVIGLTLAAL